jgi:EAL domain-containing protein (putative c-di-GMP-specific phosphodiesterase class I)
VLLPESSEDEARRVAEGLVEAIRSHPFLVAGRRARVTASVGVAPFDAHDGVETDELMASADLAMYAAKEEGRDRVAVLRRTDGERLQIRSHFSWTQRLRAAIENGGLHLAAQPILDLESGAVSQCEVLLRLVGDDGEPVSPGAFLPTAERSGLITEIDHWVVERAIELLAEEEAAGRTARLEVNLSARSLGEASLPEIIESTVDDFGVDPGNLIFEITETAAITNMDAARNFASALTRLGCRFALDDFGAGFGSFYYLKYLPLDYLKIDGDFVRKLAVSEVDQVLVRGMVMVARGLGIKTIAECVEDGEALARLRDFGVDYAQGFYVGRPQPAEAGLACALDSARPLQPR